MIASKVTNEHKLTYDLINHVYLIMHKKQIDDVPAYFARCCYQQWNWHNSEFNQQYKSLHHELNENITPEINSEYEESEYKKFLRDYIDGEPHDISDWYRRNIAKLHISGMSYREIQKNTKINKDSIVQTIKQFKDDVRNNYDKHRNSNDSDDVSAT